MKERDYSYLYFAVVFIVVFIVIGFTYYKKTQDIFNQDKVSLNDPLFSLDVLSNKAVVDPDCDKTNTLAHILYTNDEVDYAKIIDEDTCELKLNNETSVVYPTSWYTTYSKSNWPEVSFYYPEFNSEILPDITFRKVDINSEKSLLVALDEFLSNQDDSIGEMGEDDLLVSPIVVSENIKKKELTKLLNIEAVKITAETKTDSEMYYYVFKSKLTKEMWVAILPDNEFISLNEETLAMIIGSI